MRLLDELSTEHRLIEAVVGSLRTFVNERCEGRGNPADGVRFFRFLRLYAGDFHHAREEDTLFVALRERAEIPHDGPLAVLSDDHRRTGALLDKMAPLLSQAELSDVEAAALKETAITYSRMLWHHIDAEDSVLFPESEARLRKQGVGELPSRAMTDAESRALGEGRELLEAYPPLVDREIVRGDGCVCCPALLGDCPGLERAWWNEWEWDELSDHLAEG